MERIERQSHDKYTESRSKIAEYEANIQNLHASVKQLEIQLSHSQRVSSKYFKIEHNFLSLNPLTHKYVSNMRAADVR